MKKGEKSQPSGMEAYDREVKRIHGSTLEALDGALLQVDAEDLPLLARHNWFCMETGSEMRGTYAARISGGIVYLATLIVGPLPPRSYVGFLNQDPRDCRKANLVVMNRTSSRHRKPAPKRGSEHASQYRGVRWRGHHSKANPWWASIRHEGKQIYLGIHPTEEAAAKAYDAKALELHGHLAALNFPPTQAGE